MQCPHCGYVLEAFATECPRCTNLARAGVLTAEQQRDRLEQIGMLPDGDREPRHPATWPLVIITALCWPVGLFAGVIFAASPDPPARKLGVLLLWTAILFGLATAVLVVLGYLQAVRETVESLQPS
ncbi:MAG: hypothetical protein ACYC6A_00630 [Armatimonadota bacterium]